ncbi:trigger factor [Flectobacillus roseus]|uniref:Trigger factor n=1 Tax=Flectobacillus roseus TaxID=502259 RepID=A0ABT6YD94_9BACT|nr:trigger factor [Flectobacillus roseus]MDI9861088.1 trigger factor [Flectobacillus roseus]MDI9870281.1 trigger factor [Flectobacillus roseus]NBA75809.1 trigger factor [Emticicia sp. ODNR4P]
MNITLEKSSNVNAKLIVALVEEDYKSQVEKTLKDYRKRANIKGFRPGTVPMTVVQKMFGKSVLLDEINNLLGSSVQEYIKESKLNIVGDPMPVVEDQESIDWNTQKEFTFTYELGLAGDFTVDFDAIPAITSYEIQATEKEVEETIDNLKKQFAEQIHAESVEDGDMIFGTFSQGEWSEKSAIPTKSIKDEAKATFVGAAKGATLTFDIDNVFVDEKSKGLATNKKGDDVAALTGEVSFAIEDITRQGATELNQELFDKVLGAGKVSSEEEFRKEILSIIESNYVRESEYLLRIDAEKALLENISIELPEEFLKEWLVKVNEGKFTMEQIEADFEAVKRDVRWNFIKNEIADKFEVKVDYPEVIEKTKDMVRGQFGMYGPGDAQMEEMIERIANGYLTDKSKKDNFMNMFNQVYADKVAAVIVEKVKVEKKAIDVEEFKTIAGA